MKLSHTCGRRRGFTLLELLVVVGIIIVVIAFLLPAITTTTHHDSNIRCASNLKNIGLAMQIYSNNEKNNAFPRTYYSGLDEKGHWSGEPLNCSSYGGPATSLMTPASDKAVTAIPEFSSKSFHPGVVPNNCITASIFLLMRETDLTPDIFVCPNSSATRGFTVNNPKDWSNFEDAPNWGQTMTYSFACMFPGSTAETNGFRWASTVANPTDFALAADMNPGNSGGVKPPNQVTFPTRTSGSKDMARGNSNNHRNQGQNVLYADGHVQWQTSPFCGVNCVNPTTSVGFQDNIYTARVDFVTNAEQGFLDNMHYPCDGADSYLLPTDDNTGRNLSTWGF